MEIQELLTRFASGHQNFSWVNLEGADLSEANLSGIGLYSATLTGANCSHANLAQANLIKAKLQRVVLDGANLTEAKLYKADLSYASLKGADLTGADLNRANLRGADLTGAKLDQTDLNHACLAEAILDQVDLGTAILDGAILADGQVYQPPPEPLAAEAEVPEPEAVSQPEVPIAESPRVPPITTRAEFWAKLPRSVYLLGFGYFCYGLVLALMSANPITWLIVLASSLLWIIHESLLWFAPLVGPVLFVFSLSGEPGLIAIAIIGLVVVSITPMMLVIFGFRTGLSGVLLVGGLSSIWLLLCLVIFASGTIWLGLGVVIALGALSIGLGAVSWLEMPRLGFSRQQTILTCAGSAGFALLLSILLKLWLS